MLRAGEKRFRIVATVDEVKDRADAFAQRLHDSAGFDVKTFTSVDKLLNSGQHIDGADICSPHACTKCCPASCSLVA